MRKLLLLLLLVLLLLVASPAHASSNALLCTGVMRVGGIERRIADETALLDLEGKTFKPPLVGRPATITRIDALEIEFGDRGEGRTSAGVLELNSGNMIFFEQDNVTLVIVARCAPAKPVI